MPQLPPQPTSQIDVLGSSLAEDSARKFEAEQKKAAEATLELMIKFVSSSFDKAIAYTNLIIIAGYAGYFGFWSLMKPITDNLYSDVSVFLMMISVSAFVIFEVYKMLKNSGTFLGYAKILQDPKLKSNLVGLQQAIEKHEQDMRASNVKFVYIWAVTLAIAIPTACIAMGILMGVFVFKIINHVF